MKKQKTNNQFSIQSALFRALKCDLTHVGLNNLSEVPLSSISFKYDDIEAHFKSRMQLSHCSTPFPVRLTVFRM